MQLPPLKTLINTWHTNLLAICALAILVSLACQYPASVTFPMGGDAPAYISNLRQILSHPAGWLTVAGNTWYPAIYPVLAPAALVPHVSWPTRFIWWMALGQIAVGLALWRLLYPVAGKSSAALAAALWGLTPIALTPFFEDGTLAQLWSLLWLVFFIDSFARSRPWGLGVSGLLAVTAHPITALFLIVGLLLFAALARILSCKLTPIQKITVSSVVIGSLGIIAFSLLFDPGNTRAAVLHLPFSPENSPYAKELLFGSFLPWIMAAIPGFFLFSAQPGRKSPLVMLLGAFWALSWLLATNDIMGIGFWTRRLSVYVILITVIYAAYAFPRLLKRIIPHRGVQSVFMAAFIGLAALGRWQDNARIYQFYESPSRYLRASQEEIAAITWLDSHAPAGSTIIASNANRHSEWVRALTNLRYWELSEGELHRRLVNQDLHPEEYALLFTHREKAPADLLTARPELIVYQNRGAIIIHMKSP